MDAESKKNRDERKMLGEAYTQRWMMKRDKFEFSTNISWIWFEIALAYFVYIDLLDSI